MSTRNRNNTARNILTPLATIVAKQRVGEEDAKEIELPILCHFDAAKRGQCTNLGQQHLYMHLLAAQCIAARTKSRQFYDVTVKACDALMKASRRPTELLDLTTGEYNAIRSALSIYLRALPAMEVGVASGAWQFADRIMNTMPNAA